jgi:uncharacterized cupin superfamily protein
MSLRRAVAAGLVEFGDVRKDWPMSDANVFGNEPDFRLPNGVSILQVAKHAGAELLGATAYVLEAGARWADLHVHYANEEMIVVLEGTPTVYTLDGSRQLQSGEVVACLRGRRGAHRLTNESEVPARVLIVSTTNMPEIVEYPEEGEEGRVLAMTEPPYSEAQYDDSRGRLIRVFRRDQGQPIPPDRAPNS